MAENRGIEITDFDGNPPKGDSGNESANHVDARRDPESAGERARIAGFEVIDPTDIDGGTDTGDPGYQPRRRGRKPGSKNKPRTGTEEAKSNIAENLERILLSVHTMGAAFFSSPELELEAEEAKQLARAIREVSKYYPVTLDPKRLALIELGSVCAMVYGTRGVAIYRRVTAETKKPAPVTNIQDKRPVVSTPPPKASQPVNAPPKPNGAAHPEKSERTLFSPSELGMSRGVSDDPEF